MKQNYTLSLMFFLFISTGSVFGQTPDQIQEIKKKTNTKKLIELSESLKQQSQLEKEKAWSLADQKGWKKKYTDTDGVYHELVKVTDDEKPIYYKTDNYKYTSAYFSNLIAARATRANWLHNGGGLGLNVEGQGMIAHVWDGGVARRTHQEYDGIGGNNRVSLGDGGGLNFHAAHVMGTVVSSGFVADAKGMAPQGRGIAFDWSNDDAEVAIESAEGMLLSNHSYGFRASDIPDSWFGAYRGDARVQDEIMYNAPYYLQIISAGNDGNDNTSNGDPLNGQAGFDKLSGMKTAKNNMIIANAQDPQIDSEGNLILVERNSSSSEGPTDDLRIKPDITGNGTGLFSTYESADDAYNTISGTSMSAPNVTGSLLLLQQHYQNVNGKFMRAATLKGLALHTADDGGQTGPDTLYGWGLMNTKKAAETISREGLESLIIEDTLEDGETITFTVKSDEINPLYASISWTDLPGETTTGSNNTTAVLVNDLDIKVTKDSDEFFPWRLTGVNTNEKANNDVDPYERVDIDAASGTYTITITHKRTLQTGKQDFSLIVTGISSEFSFTANNSIQQICSGEESIVYNFNYLQQQGASTTNISFENLPTNATAELSRNSINEDGEFTLTINNLDNVVAGSYEIDVIANNGSEEKKRTIELTILEPVEITDPTTLVSPSNQNKNVGNTVELSWNTTANANQYYIEVSENPSFTVLLESTTIAETNFELSGLANNQIYYWRVRASNECRTGEFSETFSFQTILSDCSNTYEATDFTNADISSTNPLEISYVPIVIPDDITISRIIVSSNIEHSDISELRVYIQSPSAPTNQIDLIDGDCSGGVNMNATFDDSAALLSCNSESPAISGIIRPNESLTTNVAGQSSQGTWFVIARDETTGNGGNIISASIAICTSSQNDNVPSFTNNGIDIAANGTYTFDVNDLEATSNSEGASDQIYTLTVLPSKGTLQRNGIDLGVGDTFTQEDINTGLVSFVNTQTELFTDSFDVDITNAANGWLPNQTVNLTATTLSNEIFEIDGLRIFPNPSDGDISIRLNPKTQSSVKVILFDLQGRTIFSQSFENTSARFDESINVRNLSNGVYMLSIQEGKYMSTKRVIISK